MNITTIFNTEKEIYLLILYVGVSFFYYVFCEYLFGQSVGKNITNTFVVFRGNRFVGSVVRAFGRKIPFEPFSFFFAKPAGRWHDKLSDSRIVKE